MIKVYEGVKTCGNCHANFPAVWISYRTSGACTVAGISYCCEKCHIVAQSRKPERRVRPVWKGNREYEMDTA